MSKQFDVFLAHSSKDKPLIRQMYRQLKERGIQPWLDEEEIPPGTRFQDEIQQAIGKIKTAAICIGQEGLGRWQALEIQSFISQCVERDIPVIPVLLPDVDQIPENLIFLRNFHAVLFQTGIDDEKALFQLEWGITRVKPLVTPPSNTPVKENTEKPKAILSPQKSPSVEIELKSEKGVDYTKLRDLLAAGKWKEADEETGKVMCQAAGRTSEGWLREEDIDSFPCEDLRTINQLWLHYSNGKFGFSVQKEIYESLGGTREYNEKVWVKFCDRVGWRKGEKWLNYSDLTFNLELASPAHLPVFYCSELKFDRKKGWFINDGTSLAQRLVTCNI